MAMGVRIGGPQYIFELLKQLRYIQGFKLFKKD